jgi:hypothetical protein
MFSTNVVTGWIRHFSIVSRTEQMHKYIFPLSSDDDSTFEHKVPKSLSNFLI